MHWEWHCSFKTVSITRWQCRTLEKVQRTSTSGERKPGFSVAPTRALATQTWLEPARDWNKRSFFKRMIHKSSNMPLDLDRVTSPTQLPIRRSFSVVLKFNPLVSVLNTWGTIIETAMQFFQMAKNCFRNGKMDSKGTGLVFVWATSVPNGTP